VAHNHEHEPRGGHQPLIAACEEGFLPDELYVLENPGVGDQFDDITSMMERVVVEYGGEDPDLSVTHLEMEETDFQGNRRALP